MTDNQLSEITGHIDALTWDERVICRTEYYLSGADRLRDAYVVQNEGDGGYDWWAATFHLDNDFPMKIASESGHTGTDVEAKEAVATWFKSQ